MRETYSSEYFKDDCVNWLGYKPCPVQVANNKRDCFDCGFYSPEPQLQKTCRSNYSPEILGRSKTIGIIEMGGLGSILRTTAVTRAIRDLNPSAQIYWFTHQEGAKLLRYVPEVVPVDCNQETSSEIKKALTFS